MLPNVFKNIDSDRYQIDGFNGFVTFFQEIGRPFDDRVLSKTFWFCSVSNFQLAKSPISMKEFQWNYSTKENYWSSDFD